MLAVLLAATASSPLLSLPPFLYLSAIIIAPVVGCHLAHRGLDRALNHVAMLRFLFALLFSPISPPRGRHGHCQPTRTCSQNRTTTRTTGSARRTSESTATSTFFNRILDRFSRISRPRTALHAPYAYSTEYSCLLGAYWVRIGCVLGAYWCFADVMTNSRLQVCDGGLAPPAGLWALPAAEEGRRLLRNREDDRDLQGTSSYSDVYSPPRGAAARLTHP